LLFEPNTAQLLDRRGAEAQLRTVLDDVDIRTTISIVGHTAHVPNSRDDGRPLSRQRAQAVHGLLTSLNVPESSITKVDGVGELEPVVQPPDDPRNRAVVVVLTHRS
jgi:outer membrane protein OmpA-like peptidoglycan-associated protein